MLMRYFRFKNEGTFTVYVFPSFWWIFLHVLRFFLWGFDRHLNMADEAWEGLLEYFLDDDSGDEFEGFTEDDLRRMGETNVESDTEDSDNENEENNVPDGYSHGWLVKFEEMVGPTNIPENMSQADYFFLFFTDEVVDFLVTETNRYAEQVREKEPDAYRVRTWREVDRDEMKAFLCLLLLTGLTKRSSYDLYWSTDPLIEMPGFRSVMSRNRFLNILAFLHLCNNNESVPRDDPNHDKAFKVRFLFEKLLPLWQKYFNPGKELSVDESMIPFKGRTNLMQYMPAKPNKWGLKAWGLADAKTGYMYNWDLYLGKDNNNPRQHGVAHHVVTSLASKLYNKGHVLYMDNFFSSPPLFHELAENDMAACGTLRTNRQGVLQEIKQGKPKAGEPPLTARDGKILYISWFDKRPVNLMTTAHSAETFKKTVRSKRHAGNVREVQKPAAMQAYSQHMGGIDRADKAMTYYMVLHRCVKWWKKVFFYLLEICFCNALVIYKQQVKPQRVNAEKFRLAICHGLLRTFEPTIVRAGRPPSDPPMRMITANFDHFPGINPKRTASGKPSKPDCVVCSDRAKKRCQTQYICKKCREPMCMYPCFQRWHTLVDYRIECSKELHHQ